MYLIKYLPTYLPMWLYLIWDLVKTLQRNDLYRTIIFIFTPPPKSFAERLQSDLSSPCRKVLVKKNLFISKSWHNYHLSMASWACVEYQFSDLSLCYLQQTVHFSSQIRMPSFAINLPSLINLCTNMIQIKLISVQSIFYLQPEIISDQICDLRKQNMLGLSDVLITINQQYQHRTNQKLRSWANTVFQNCGVFEANVSFSFPAHHFSFLLLSQLSRRTRAKRLLCRP